MAIGQIHPLENTVKLCKSKPSENKTFIKYTAIHIPKDDFLVNISLVITNCANWNYIYKSKPIYKSLLS